MSCAPFVLLAMALVVAVDANRVPRQAFPQFPPFPGPRAQQGRQQQYRQAPQIDFRPSQPIPARPGQVFDIATFQLDDFPDEEDQGFVQQFNPAPSPSPTPAPPPPRVRTGTRRPKPRPAQAQFADAQTDYQLPAIRVPVSQRPGPRPAASIRGNSLSKGNKQELDEEELEEEKPDRLTILLQESDFTCSNKKDGYYADEKLSCEVFHYCQDNGKHSWICPNGFTFHQVHLICMPPSNDNICTKSSDFHFVNDFLYRPIELDERNGTLRYADRYFPDDYVPGVPFTDHPQGAPAPAPAAPATRVYAQQAYRDDIAIPVIRGRPAGRANGAVYRAQQVRAQLQQRQQQQAQQQQQQQQAQQADEEYDDDAYFRG